MEVKLAMAKVHKYAVSESGDTFEITERPKGGLSLILADGQGSGRSAKQNSNLVVAKAVAMIGEGARDGAVARAVHDMLFAARDGKISAELLIVSADTASNTLVISRNTACPVLVYRNAKAVSLPGEAGPIGVRASTKPLIDVLPLEPVTTILGFSDGIWHAGRTYGQQWTTEELAQLVDNHIYDPVKLVEIVLAGSMTRDQGRPRDDMTVFAVTVVARSQDNKTRRMTASFPI
ncbi:MAG: SpoIIE family protein phosphatase [Firmicutes bacterium]|nr:SpoIIE family protein phosphatase [Bacillota bacterium]